MTTPQSTPPRSDWAGVAWLTAFLTVIGVLATGVGLAIGALLWP